MTGSLPGARNPAFVAWLLAQRRGVASTEEPHLSITAPIPQAVLTTSATTLSLSGSAAALGLTMTQVAWTNHANNASGVASGTSDSRVANLPLVTGRTHVVVVVGTTTGWVPGMGGTTTFNALTVIQARIRTRLTPQGTEALLNWTGGEAPYRVERATDLGVGVRTDHLPQATPPVSLPLDDTAGCYRMIGR